jgi:hypothetical protein
VPQKKKTQEKHKVKANLKIKELWCVGTPKKLKIK